MNSFVDFAFLDSGTGGIPYMKELKKMSPESRCVYLGDTAHFPYGQKSAEQITECASGAVSLIIKKWNPRAIVIACNTISVTSLSELRKRFAPLPIVGTVPAIRLGAKVTQNKKIGLLATNATVNNPYNKKLISDFAQGCDVFSRGDPDLISFIEHSLFTATASERLEAVRPAVDYFKECGCDTIILGCTHFTHIYADVQKAAGADIKVVDSRDGVAKQALRVERECDGGAILQSEHGCKELVQDMSFFATSAPPRQEREYKLLCSNFCIPWGGVVR